MSGVLHLVLGPAEHGVVRHGMQIARACGHDLGRDVADLERVRAGDVVHVSFTDRLFGSGIDAAVTAFAELAARIAARGAALSVTLHDVPHDDSALQRRRRAGYEQVVALARGVVVNSRVELALLGDAADAAHSLRMIPLPVDVAAPATGADVVPGRVGVLGFVFPDRGYEDVLAALPGTAHLTALGRAADGHEDLPARYAAVADGRWHCTGYIADDALAAELAATAVPVAPNRRVTASASINTWIAHGRRPLVPDSPYARELVAERPGTVTLYTPDSLPAELAAALVDPSRTVLAADVARGPATAEVADAYRRHLASCAPPRVVAGPGGPLVPDNRWDLLAGEPAGVTTVSVVIPYYDAQAGLDRVLAALAAQTRPPEQIVVADDGSAVAPRLDAAGPVPVVLVRQDDLGFRAAGARNLGAAAATGEVLVFLDADTVPEPGFLAAITRLPATSPDAVSVGRRRHRDPASGRELPEPGWLRDAYEASADLLRADRRSYRYVISAVLALGAGLFAAVGGFDERFVGYGGEDWELAHRLRTAGALLAHVPDAVAWHDGPDWAGRGDPVDRSRAKNAETAILAGLLPDPDARGGGRWAPYPSVVVYGGTMSDVDALATVRSAAHLDCAFWFDEVHGPRRDLVLADPAVRLGVPGPDVLARAWCRAELHGPTDLGNLMDWAGRAERHGRVASPALTLTATRADNRVARAAGDESLRELLFGHHDRAEPLPATVTDLAGWLAGRR